MLSLSDKKFIIECIKSNNDSLAKEIVDFFSVTNKIIDTIDEKLDTLNDGLNTKMDYIDKRIDTIEDKIFITTIS